MEPLPQLALDIAPVERRVLDALFAALEEVPLKELSVTELARQAGISRKTFYSHFGGIDDVVDLKARIMARDLMVYELVSIPSLMEPRSEKDTLDEQVICFFSFLGEHATALRALQRNDLLQRFLTVFWREVDALSANPPTDARGIYQRLFAAGGYSAIIDAWLSEDPLRSPQEMLEIMGSVTENLSRHRPW